MNLISLLLKMPKGRWLKAQLFSIMRLLGMHSENFKRPHQESPNIPGLHAELNQFYIHAIGLKSPACHFHLYPTDDHHQRCSVWVISRCQCPQLRNVQLVVRKTRMFERCSYNVKLRLERCRFHALLCYEIYLAVLGWLISLSSSYLTG